MGPRCPSAATAAVHTSQLWAELEAAPRQHSANLRQALADMDAGAWSAPEARAATILRGADVPPFEQNARIDLSDGRYLIVDFLWRELRAILEIDSDEHHGDPGDRDSTDDRHLVLETLGYSVAHRRPRLIMGEPGRFRWETECGLAGRPKFLA